MIYQSKKFSSNFNVKDKTEFYSQSNLVYYGKCLNQTDRRINERIIDHKNVI